MRFSDINPGTKLEITLYSENGKTVGPIMASEIDSVLDEENMVIAAPFYQGIIYPLKVSTHVRISFCGENAMYSFRGIITERGRHIDKLEYMTINKLGEIRKIQRREFFRFDCILDIRFRAIELPEENRLIDSNTNTAYSYFESYTTDISGGGLCFITGEKFNLRQTVALQIDLGEAWISLKGKVVRVDADEKSTAERYRVGVSFTDIRERDRQKIIEYIFKQQRNLREKGLI